MSTLQEDLKSIDTLEDKVVRNKVARFAYTENAYTKDLVDGVVEYDVNKEQNIPVGTASVMKVNETVLNKGYRAQASSITRMLMNHFLGRISYNLNKVNDVVSSFIKTVKKNLGSANGIATLDSDGRIPFTQLPESAMEFMGTWDASTNTPTLTDGTGTNGSFYVVSVAGTQTFGGVAVSFNTNDRIIYDGKTASWTKLSSGDVRAVNNITPDATGNITLDAPDVNAVKTINNISPDKETGNLNLKSLSINGKSFNGSSTVDAGVQAIKYGGTGATIAKGAEFNITADMKSQTSDFTDTTKITCVQESPSVSTGRFFYSSASYLWNYIKGKISSVLGLTATNYGGTALNATNAEQAITATTATTATTANKIVPNYAKSLVLTAVTSATTKYIKLADCTWNQTGTLQVYLAGNSFEDTLVINFGGGNSIRPTLCGYYNSHSILIKSVIAQKGSAYNSNYSIYIKIILQTTCTVKVALLKGSCTINITESTTAPTNISEWPVSDGFFGNLTGNVTGNVTGNLTGNVTGNLTGNVTGNATNATTADKVKNALIINGQSFDGSSAVNISIQEGAYDHIVYNDASLLEWANCTDGSMKKVLIKSGTYNMTKGVNLTNAGTGYVLAERGAVINSHVPIAFKNTNSSVTTVIHNLSVICCASLDSSFSCAFSSSYIDYLTLYNCTAEYDDGTTKVKSNLFNYCTCYNCKYNCALTYNSQYITIKVFEQCKCYNCRCKHINNSNSVQVKFSADSYFYGYCRCISCTADIYFYQSIQGTTYSFRCYESCGECVGCVAEFSIDSGKSIPQFQYGFRACNYLSGCKEAHPTSFDTAIRGIDNCSFISSTTASTGNSNTYVGSSCKIG